MSPVSLKDNQSKIGTVRIIRENGDEHLLPLVLPPAIDGRNPTPVSESRVGAFPEKVVTGDFTRFNHPWLSAFVQSDWSGGMLIRDSQEATDISRYWTGSLETRYPHAVSLPPYVGTIALGGNTDPCVVVGDIKYGGVVSFLVAYGTELRTVDDALALQGTNALDHAPVATGTAFRGNAHAAKRLFIPLGANGYDIYDPATDSLIGTSTTILPLNFVEWNHTLWAVDGDGQTWQNVTGDDAGWVAKVRVDGDGDATSIQRYYDQSGAPCLFVVTDRDVQVIAVSDQEAYVTSLEYAPHPDAGRSAARWREWLAVSYGVDIARYDGATVEFVGLAADHGLPAELRGAITGMAPGWNDLFVLLEGATTVAADHVGIATDIDGDLILPGANAQSAVFRLDSLGGWHPLWISGQTARAATNITVSAKGGGYWVFWGFDGKLYYSKLIQAFQNPAEDPDHLFATSGSLTSPWLDMNMAGMTKILAAIDIRHKNCTADRTITMEYQIDDDDLTNTWRTAFVLDGPADEHGRTLTQMGAQIALPGSLDPITAGLAFSRFRYRLSMGSTGDSTATSPLVESISVIYFPKIGTYLSWSFTVDCTKPDTGMFNGLGNRERQELITQLMEDAFVAFSYREGEWLQVKFSGAGGANQTNVYAGDREVTLISVYQMHL